MTPFEIYEKNKKNGKAYAIVIKKSGAIEIHEQKESGSWGFFADNSEFSEQEQFELEIDLDILHENEIVDRRQKIS